MRHRRHARRSSRAARLLAAASVLLMTATAALLVSALASPDRGIALRPAAGAVESPPSEPAGVAGVAGAERAGEERRWRTVLARLDDLRARAYARLRPALLRRVYTPGSQVLTRDRALLLRYRQRGLRVVGLRTRLVDVARVGMAGDRVVLRVRDRVVAGSVAGAGRTRRLPADEADTRHVVLRRATARGWLVQAVQPVRAEPR